MAEVIELGMPDGSRRKAIEVSFEIGNEEWNVYNLNDGGRVRLRTSVTKVFRILEDDGKTPARTDDGDPWVQVRSNTLIVASD